MVPRETFQTSHYFDLTDTWFSSIFSGFDHVWGVLAPQTKETWIAENLRPNVKGLPREGSYVTKTTKIPVNGGEAVIEAGAIVVGDEIELRSGVHVEAGAWIQGPSIFGNQTLIRHGAYVRGGVITGRKVVIGHATEVKSAIFFNHAKAPHFAYVGDSILGNHVNLGAGTKISNLKITNDEVILRIDNEKVSTGLRKMGAVIGDHTQTGCNSVLNPGVLLGKHCLVYPAIAVKKSYYAPKSILK